MDQTIKELPDRGLRLLLMGEAAHEVECEGHVAVQDRIPARVELESGRRGTDTADLNRLFRGA